MDKKLKKYEKAILGILEAYAKIKYANVKGGNQLIADKKKVKVIFGLTQQFIFNQYCQFKNYDDSHLSS